MTDSPTATVSTGAVPVTVEIWSDIVCPWCYIGKRRFERALADLAGEVGVDVRYRPYQLDPTAAPGVSQPALDAYAKKFGGPDQARAIVDRVTATAAGDGLGFRLDRARRANTLLAHRLLWWSDRPESGLDQHDVKEALLRAYFTEGRDVGDPDTLADIAAEHGADRDAAARFLASDAGRAEVDAEIARAAELGITAVPTYVVNGRWAIPGAQDPATFVTALRRIGELSGATLTASGTDAPDTACTDEACEL